MKIQGLFAASGSNNTIVEMLSDKRVGVVNLMINNLDQLPVNLTVTEVSDAEVESTLVNSFTVNGLGVVNQGFTSASPKIRVKTTSGNVNSVQVRLGVDYFQPMGGNLSI